MSISHATNFSRQTTYKREALRVHGTGLNQKFVSPAVECVKALGVVDVVYKDAAVGASVECDTERLEALLSGGIPELFLVSIDAVL